MEGTSNENPMEIEVIDRVKRVVNKFNKFQTDMKKKGKSGLARDVKANSEQWTDQDKQKSAGEVEAGQKKPIGYRSICDVNHFIKFLDEIPQINKDKLGDSPFAHFLNLKNKKLQVKEVSIILSHCLQDDMHLQLFKGTQKEDMEVKKEDFSRLMGIGEMEPISDNKDIDDNIVEKFCAISDKGKRGDISMTMVKSVLNDVKEDENHIKRAFALIAMLYIVCPPKRTTLEQKMLRHVNDVNALKSQPWATLAINALLKGRHDGKTTTKYIGGCIFFLQLYLMKKQDDGLELLTIDEEQIKKFKLKWEQDYARQSALIGYSQPLVNKIVRDIQKVREYILNKNNPINLKDLMDIDETLAKVTSQAAAQEDKSNKSAPESSHGSDQENRAAPVPKRKRKKKEYQNEIVGAPRVTRAQSRNLGIDIQ